MIISVRVPQANLSRVQEAVRSWTVFYEEAFENPYPGFNEDQSLMLDGDILTYVGQRCPLHQDGAFRAFHAAAFLIGWPDLEVLEYETSDPRLNWWDTLESAALKGLQYAREPQRNLDPDRAALSMSVLRHAVAKFNAGESLRSHEQAVLYEAVLNHPNLLRIEVRD